MLCTLPNQSLKPAWWHARLLPALELKKKEGSVCGRGAVILGRDILPVFFLEISKVSSIM